VIKRILFVCTGNACRSPMAKVLFEDMVSKDQSLRSAEVEVDSAGTDAVLDAATPEAIKVMSEYGLNLNSHQPKTVHSGLADWADLVLVMESWQKGEVARQIPAAAEKTYMLSEFVGERSDIPDPYHRGLEAYRKCAASLQSLLNKLAERLES